MPSILRTPIVRKFHSYTGDVITQGSVTILNTPSGSTATIYSSETGIGTTSQPLALQSDGGVNGWIEIGIYDITAETSIGTVTSRYYSNHPQQSLLQGTATADSQFQIKDDGDAYPRVSISSGGTISFGSGTSVADTNLYRSAADTLKTDDNFIVTGNKTVSGTSFYPDGTSAAPSITFTNSSTTGLWKDTNGLNSTFLVSNRKIERGTAVPTVTTTSTLSASSIVGKSTNTGGLIILNPGATQTFTLPTAALIYAEFGYVGAVFSFTLTNISANACTITNSTGITDFTNLLAFAPAPTGTYSLGAGLSLTIKYYVVSATTGYIVAATI